MRLFLGASLGGAAAALFLGGCGADVEASCVSACEKANECSDVKQDCNDACDDAVRAAEETGCESETVALYDCVGAEAECSSDVGDDVCREELNEVFGCLISYCVDNPGDEICFGTEDDTSQGDGEADDPAPAP